MKKNGRIAALSVLLAVFGAAAYFIFNSKARPAKPQTAGSSPAKSERTGAWVDEVVFREEADRAKAINMFEAGEIQVYGLGITDPELYRRIQASRVLQYEI